MATEEQGTNGGGGVATAGDTLTVTDNRTGQTYEVPIEDGTIRALALRDIKVDEDDFGLMTYDPAFMNTASCRSGITYIDGDRGVLEYRGYPIEQLAEQSTYLEVAYLLVHGELPTQSQLDEWTHQITIHTFVHENVKKFIEGFRYDAHPMGMLVWSVGTLSTFYPDANQIQDADNRYIRRRGRTTRRRTQRHSKEGGALPRPRRGVRSATPRPYLRRRYRRSSAIP